MKIKLKDGTSAEITDEEAGRISDEYYNEPKTFLNRALDNIQKMTGVRPHDEDSLKKLMYEKIMLGDEEHTNLFYEMIEAIIGMFAVESM